MNIFEREPNLTNKHRHKLTNFCGGLLSIPIIVILFALFILKFIQLTTRGIVYSSSQLTTTYEPAFTTFTTANDPSYAPFMIGVSVANADSCSPPITMSVNANAQYGNNGSANKTATNVPVKLELCNATHFSMLPNSINKLSQYTSKKPSCLPLNNYFDLGGDKTVSSEYKSLKFNLICPPGCASPCGTAEFFVVDAYVNLNNRDLFAYSLNRKLFNIENNPKFANYYQLQKTNTVTDSGVLPFGAQQSVNSFSVANILTDIPSAAGENSTMITV